MAKKVLVVDDSASVRQQVSAVLIQEGYDIIEAENGLDGVEKIDNTNQLSMVLVDINMPIMNGLELLEKIQSHIRAGLPVVVLTSEGQPAMIKRAKALGARGWIIKPFNAANLVATVSRLTQ